MELPDIIPFQEIEFDQPTALVAVAGFEDRATAIFEEIISRGDSGYIQSGAGIHYRPFDERNDVEAVRSGFSSINLSKTEIDKLVFNRYDPDSFEPIFEEFLESISEKKVIIDISGMSKLLIMTSLRLLAKKEMSVTIFYAEAEEYSPTQSEYNERMESTENPDKTPAFLSNGIYDIVTSRGLSSIVGSSQPMVVVAFPTFNHQELMALASELSPTQMVAIEGEPRLEPNKWRKDAIRDLNKSIESYIPVDWKEVSTFDYKSTLTLLNSISDEYANKYRLVLAPTGSKLQTVSCLLFRRQHKGVQVVYPVTREYSETYTKGWDATWGIKIEDLDETITTEQEEYQEKISDLKMRIENMNNSVGAD